MEFNPLDKSGFALSVSILWGKIKSIVPTKTSQLQNDSGFGKAAPLTTSLAVTEEGVSALDGTVGKVLNDKGTQMSVYVGTDGNLHFRNWNGADTVIPFNSFRELILVSSIAKNTTRRPSYTVNSEQMDAGTYYVRVSAYSNGGDGGNTLVKFPTITVNVDDAEMVKTIIENGLYEITLEKSNIIHVVFSGGSSATTSYKSYFYVDIYK